MEFLRICLFVVLRRPSEVRPNFTIAPQYYFMLRYFSGIELKGALLEGGKWAAF